MNRLFTSALLLMAAAPAYAAPTASAVIAPGAELPGRLVVGDHFWRCADGRCSGPGETRPVAMMKTCLALARQLGAVTGLRVGETDMPADALARCNTKAGHAPAALAAK